MKIALVHDYLREFGGAERVLKTLTEMYPDAPIYTAFRVNDSAAGKEFADKDIRESFLAPILRTWKLYSPLRFLTPLIWKSMDLSEYDVVITSASWYITRGFKVGKNTKVICYCHTPPRWLYGYETSVGLQKYWIVRMYAKFVGDYIRKYDASVAGTVDKWIANSENVKRRIKKFYRKESEVIYPPIDVVGIKKLSNKVKKGVYFLIVSRLVGAKGLEEAVEAFKGSKYKLKIVGEKAGFSDVEKRLEELSGGNVELLGRVSDNELYKLYGGAIGFIALAREEDFGMTVVEAQAAGTPVIAFNGGGFKESAIDGKTGFLIDDTDVKTIQKYVEKMANKKWNRSTIQNNAMKFDRSVFEKKIKNLVKK